MSPNTELRKLKPIELFALANILNISDNWKKLMAIVPKEEKDIPRFDNEDISIIEQAATQQNTRNAAEIFLIEWGTIGRKRPTLGILLDLLIKAELFRAADYIACDILKQERPKRPDHGPLASIDISDAAIQKLLNEQQFSQDTFSDLLLSEPSTEQKIDKIYFEDKIVDNLVEAGNKDSSHIVERNINHDKSVDVSPPKNASDLIEFSVTNTYEADVDHTLASAAKEQVPNVTNNKTVNSKNSLHTEYYKELSSSELPVFLRKAIQPVTTNNKETSSIFLNKSVQFAVSSATKDQLSDTTNNEMDNSNSLNSLNTTEQYYKELSSSELPVFLRKPIQIVIINDEATSSSVPPNKSVQFAIQATQNQLSDTINNEMDNSNSPNITEQYYKELSSSELPLFLRKPMQIATISDEAASSSISVNKLMQSAAIPDGEIPSCELPLCLRR